MKIRCAFGMVALLLSGCATQMVEHNAKESCATEGKKAFVVDLKQSGIPLFLETASAKVLCVGPDDITHMPADFGADAVSASNLHGAGIFSVTPGSVADKAGLKPEDVVYEFAGRSIARATDLRVAVDSMSPGDEALIKLRRNGGHDLTVTAHFILSATPIVRPVKGLSSTG
jgi:predicted metalloprotease with PDZ domain